MYTSLFWKDLFERFVATIAQVAAGLLSADVLGGNIEGFSGLPWEAWLITLGVSGALVVLKGVAALQKSDTVSPASFAPAAPDLAAVSVEDASENYREL